MTLLSITDLETATNQSIDPADYLYYNWYINVASAYIEDYTGQDFSPHVDEIILAESGDLGLIHLDGLTGISLVELWDPYGKTWTTQATTSYAYDGVSDIYNLCQYTTYRLTVNYGWDTVPESLKGIATSLVLAGTGLDPSAINGLVMKRVGDREEQYGISGNGETVSVNSIQAEVLDSYRGTARTFRV